MAPFWDNNDDGIYNPADGDYPFYDLDGILPCGTSREHAGQGSSEMQPCGGCTTTEEISIRNPEEKLSEWKSEPKLSNSQPMTRK
jgi:hypothetical protein